MWKSTISRSLFCLLAGAAASLAMAPYHLWPVLFAAISLFYLLLVQTRHSRTAALYGWLFGFGYLAFGLSWIGNALLVDGNPQAWAWPLAVTALPAALALYFACSAYCIRRFYNLNTIAGFFGFIGFLTLGEWLRSVLFTGFPWNLFAHSWAATLPMIQITAPANVYFLNLLTIFWTALPALLWLLRKERTKFYSLLAAGLLTILIVAGWGAMRLQANPTTYTDHSIRIVQPNIPQAEKWQREKMIDHFLRHTRLSQRTNSEPAADVIIWPETALNFFLAQDRGIQASLRHMLQTHTPSSLLVTGMLNFDPATQTYQNAVVAIDARGDVVQRYNKHHLVPFGEYIPFQRWIPLTPVVEFEGFAPGPGPQTLTFLNPALRIAPAICYEIIFSGALRDHKNPPPDLIVNVTNDGWYGRSAGPYQHLDQAIFRAVEEGVPVARAANTGISALQESGFMDNKLPHAKIFFSIPAFLKTFALLMFLLVLCTIEPILRVRYLNFKLHRGKK
ncbi:MAG: apolipoprotein N-acyltransferase [Alphaproteobacteria bacterium]|nr:apolipoprotein N-acyltransferase [Alphaproteobacteria bacterium]